MKNLSVARDTCRLPKRLAALALVASTICLAIKYALPGIAHTPAKNSGTTTY